MSRIPNWSKYERCPVCREKAGDPCWSVRNETFMKNLHPGRKMIKPQKVREKRVMGRGRFASMVWKMMQQEGWDAKKMAAAIGQRPGSVEQALSETHNSMGIRCAEKLLGAMGYEIKYTVVKKGESADKSAETPS